MAFVSSFTGATLRNATFTSSSIPKCDPQPRNKGTVRALFTPEVDEYMARSVNAQYISKACPSGEPPIQCIEGTTADEVFELRTLKRQSELRYYQLPTAVKIHNYYEMRKAGVVAAHGCSHEEGRVLDYPKMAAAYVLGQAEADKACIRYFESAPTSSPEHAMVRSVENLYQQAVNGSGVFSTACTDGQAKYEAYLAQNRGKSTMFRAKQYSVAQKEAMKYASRKQALTQKGHDCSYEEGIFNKFPAVASAMRPTFGYYPPFVTNPRGGAYAKGIPGTRLPRPIAPITGPMYKVVGYPVSASTL